MIFVVFILPNWNVSDFLKIFSLSIQWENKIYNNHNCNCKRIIVTIMCSWGYDKYFLFELLRHGKNDDDGRRNRNGEHFDQRCVWEQIECEIECALFSLYETNVEGVPFAKKMRMLQPKLLSIRVEAAKRIGIDFCERKRWRTLVSHRDSNESARCGVWNCTRNCRAMLRFLTKYILPSWHALTD